MARQRKKTVAAKPATRGSAITPASSAVTPAKQSAIKPAKQSAVTPAKQSAIKPAKPAPSAKQSAIKPAKPSKKQQAKQRQEQIEAAIADATTAAMSSDVETAVAAITRVIPIASTKRQRELLQAACHNCGNRFIFQQKWAECVQLYELGVSIYREGDDNRLTAEMANEAGFSRLQLRQLDEAEQWIERGIALHGAAERHDGIAIGLYYLSNVAFDRVQLARAAELGREAVAISKSQNNDRGVAFHSYALARALYEQGHTRDAEKIALEAAPIAQRLNLSAVEGNLSNMLANVALDDHRLAEAEKRYQRALVLFRQQNLKTHETITIANLGNLAANEGRYDEALERYETALAKYQELGESRLAAIALTARAGVYTELGQYSEAQLDLEYALATMTSIGHERRVSFVRSALARLAEARGELAEARAHYAETEMSLEAVGDTVEVGRMLYGAAGIEADLDDPESAEALLARAAALDPASLTDDTGRGEKRAGMTAVRMLRELATARIELAKSRRATGDEARAFREAARERLDRIESAKDSLVERSCEVRRVARLVRAKVPLLPFVAQTWSGNCIGDRWGTLELELELHVEGSQLLASGSAEWEERQATFEVSGHRRPGRQQYLHGTLTEVEGLATIWNIRLELELDGDAIRGTLIEIYDEPEEGQLEGVIGTFAGRTRPT